MSGYIVFDLVCLLAEQGVASLENLSGRRISVCFQHGIALNVKFDGIIHPCHRQFWQTRQNALDQALRRFILLHGQQHSGPADLGADGNDGVVGLLSQADGLLEGRLRAVRLPLPSENCPKDKEGVGLGRHYLTDFSDLQGLLCIGIGSLLVAQLVKRKGEPRQNNAFVPAGADLAKDGDSRLPMIDRPWQVAQGKGSFSERG